MTTERGPLAALFLSVYILNKNNLKQKREKGGEQERERERERESSWHIQDDMIFLS